MKTVDKQVVFVVSVDDQALRRHLIAKETERSREEDALAIRRYVDEYLAKFFSARLPILTRLAGAEAGERIGAVFSALCAAGQLDPAAALLESADAYLRPQLPVLAEAAAPHLIERVNSGEALPAALFEELAAVMGEAALNSLAEALAARLRDGAPGSRDSRPNRPRSSSRASSISSAPLKTPRSAASC